MTPLTSASVLMANDCQIVVITEPKIHTSDNANRA